MAALQTTTSGRYATTTSSFCFLRSRPRLCASIGCGDFGGKDGGGDSQRGAVGPHGIDHVNAAGRRLRSFMESHALCSLTSFFPKKAYGTWVHPRSRLPHQLDHVLVTRSDRRRFVDAAACPFQLISSDHRAVGCKLRFRVQMQRRADPRSKMLKLDYSPLQARDEQQRTFMQSQASYLSGLQTHVLGDAQPSADSRAGRIFRKAAYVADTYQRMPIRTVL